MYALIFNNFRVSVLITVLGYLLLFYITQSGYPETVDHLVRYKVHALVIPIVFAFLTLIFWFSSYRHHEGHIAAFIMGFCFLIPPVGAWISEAVNGLFYRDLEALFFLYIGLSHIAYSFLNIKEVLLALGKNADYPKQISQPVCIAQASLFRY